MATLSMKFANPGNDNRYKGLMKVDPGLAIKTFENNRDFYHPICRAMVEKELFGKAKG